jgi:hypothetical protein
MIAGMIYVIDGREARKEAPEIIPECCPECGAERRAPEKHGHHKLAVPAGRL